MVTISLEEVEHDIPGLLRRVELGESFTIARDGKPFGTLKPIADAVQSRFYLGSLEGKGVIPDDIKGPYEAEINQMFYGE